jgi:uncharacterized protein (DUF736 family)
MENQPGSSGLKGQAMAYEQKDLTGSLFKNDRKESDTHPDYKGSALLNGVDHWMDAWINTAKDGSKYMSLKFKPKEARRAGDTNLASSMNQAAALDDDVPF